VKATIYVRVSSEEQASSGSGIERQLEAATNYCKARDFSVIQILRDEGKSASKGHHISHGEFGKYLDEVRAGKHRGTALVIEYLDRLSRLGIEKTIELLKALREGGVEVHEVKNNKVFRLDANDDLGSWITTVVDSYQAQEYTKKLAQRSTEGKAKKLAEVREKLAKGQSTNRGKNCPAWLEIAADGKYVGVTERKKVVRLVNGEPVYNKKRKKQTPVSVEKVPVAMVREGMRLAIEEDLGFQNIAAKLNDGLSATWWQRTLISRTLLGEFQPTKMVEGKEVPNGEVMKLYPPIVTEEEFAKLQKAVETRRRCDGIRAPTVKNLGKNLFQGLTWDVSVNPVRRLNFQLCERGCYLYTAFSKEDSETTHRMDYYRFEEVMLRSLEREDWKKISDFNKSQPYQVALAKLNELEAEIDKASRRLETFNAALDGESDVATVKVLAGRIAKEEAALSTLSEQKDAARAVVASEQAQCEALHDPETLLELARQVGDKSTPESRDLRLKLKVEISRRIEKINVDFHPAMEGVKLEATIIFKSGYKGCIFFRD
jgi:DNA invertase Pin-like site-specific DNA recombinase